MIAPDMFSLSDVDGTSSAVCDVVPRDREELVREAAQSCPEQAILIEESRGNSSLSGNGHKVGEMTS